MDETNDAERSMIDTHDEGIHRRSKRKRRNT